MTAAMHSAFSTADLALARRVEAAEASNGFRLAPAIAKCLPATGVVAQPFLGGCAVFGGVGSPFTHALGIGMNGAAAAGELDRMEAFFRDRGSPVLIDLCPLADPSLIQLIFARGYRVIEFNNVLIRRLGTGERLLAPPGALDVSLARAEELDTWNRTVARGFAEQDDIGEDVLAMLAGSAAVSQCYLVRKEGEPVAGAAMGVNDGVAMFYGDATLVNARRFGAQRALIDARLRDACEAGCDLAMASVIPGSGSHRNYESAGFQLFFMRVNISLP